MQFVTISKSKCYETKSRIILLFALARATDCKIFYAPEADMDDFDMKIMAETTKFESAEDWNGNAKSQWSCTAYSEISQTTCAK